MTLINWIKAMRLRTLPLALGCITLATAVVSVEFRQQQPQLVALLFVTTMLLQILSNFANDYGDGMSGVDNEKRQGPERLLASGKIAPHQLKLAVVITAVLAFGSGCMLLWLAPLTQQQILIFFGLGIGAIIAAITYTMGKRPYGYIGLGDLAVFVFFGPVAVIGASYMLAGQASAQSWLLAVSAGLLATAVLNINNIRDIDTDVAAGKHTVASRLGRKRAQIYHYILVSLAVVLAFTYLFLQLQGWVFFSWLMLPLFVQHARQLSKINHLAEYNQALKFMVLMTFAFELIVSMDLLMA